MSLDQPYNSYYKIFLWITWSIMIIRWFCSTRYQASNSSPRCREATIAVAWSHPRYVRALDESGKWQYYPKGWCLLWQHISYPEG